MNRPFVLAALAASLLTLAACDVGNLDSGTNPSQSLAPGCDNDIVTCMEQRSTPPPTVIDAAKKYTATVHTTKGDFTITLVDAKVAPQTVNNFVYLSQNHFYDGLTFHRVVAGFVVQGGDPKGDGTGGPAYKLPNETNASQWPRGTLGMASSSAGVSGSQFFITLGDAPFLASNGVYNHFGQVGSGMDVVDKLQVGDSMRSIDISAS
ncbi:MAG TPA: peptidylprolyl isomerase [Candidatus Dormibacteraeota bacterium]|nr:peptidylprolyl isomerase [Candidatus Dormibacteraeota bacterium]